MANHKNAEKAQRQNEKRRAENKYYSKTMRNALKKVRTSKDEKEVKADLPKVVAMIDKLARKKVIHKNKAANLKSSLMKQAVSMSK